MTKEKMKAIILAGGKGVRLSGIVKDIPKPMAPVSGKPFLEYLISQLVKSGIKEITLSVGYKAGIISSYFKEGKRFGAHIDYCVEEKPLGTGGALKKAATAIEDKHFIAMNGDSFLELDIKNLIAYHSNKHARATLALACVRAGDRYGCVETSDKGEVTGFREKDPAGDGLVNAGVYILNRDIFRNMPDGNFSIEKDIFPVLAGKGLYGFKVKGFFKDIGMPEDYLELRKDPSELLALT